VSKDKILTLGYSVLSNRLANITPPHISLGYEVLISIQNPKALDVNLPKSFAFKSFVSNEWGVAKSRNIILKQADTKYLLFADDDITFLDAGVCKVIEYLESHPECDLVLAQAHDEKGVLRKNYPTRIKRLTSYNSAKAATYEMVVRVQSVRGKGIAFDENFGAGVTNFLGDEYIFITDLLGAAGRGVFLPVTIAVHPADSSGSLWGTPKDLAARAQVFTRVFGIWAPLWRAGFYLKNFAKVNRTGEFIRFVRGKI